MKRIVLGILFLFVAVWGYDTVTGEVPVVAEPVVSEETLQMVAHPDELVSVVLAANSFADVSVRTNIPFSYTNFVRRYRPAGFVTDRWFEYLTSGQEVILGNTLKTNVILSEVYAARLKDCGYYIYALRKIVI